MTTVESILIKLNNLQEEQIQKVSGFIDELDDDAGLEQHSAEAIERYNQVKRNEEGLVPAERFFNDLGL